MAAPPDAITVPAKLIEAAGIALEGERWQAGLARRLNVNIRTVERWAEAAREDRGYKVSRALIEEIAGHLERTASECYRTFEAIRVVIDA